jgi:hypothetical protein
MIVGHNAEGSLGEVLQLCLLPVEKQRRDGDGNIDRQSNQGENTGSIPA